MTTLAAETRATGRADGDLRIGSWLMGVAALGFIGYASSTACQLTSDVAAHWLSQFYRGELALPAAAEMEWTAWKVRHRWGLPRVDRPSR